MRSLVIAIVAALGLAAPSVAADSTEAAALVHLERGIAAFEAGDHALAHRELRAAHELAPDRPNPYRWLALTEIQLGDCPAALRNIAGFVARVPAGDPRLAEIGRLRELCERTGVLRIDSTPAGASLRLDGAIVGTTPYRSRSLRVGTHELVADQPGFLAASRSVVVTAGSELDVHLRLTREPTPITRRWWFIPAVVGVVALAGAAIFVIADGPDETLLPPVECDGAGCRPGGS
ncbi:MAG: PEGA domain-containing protein [Myxococcota bacterium]|nr:PEGA domain-containing protein [Myxococcota bacterium]